MLPAFLRNFTKHSTNDNPAVRFASKLYTYSEFNERVNKTANFLLGSQSYRNPSVTNASKEPDVIAILSPNNLMHLQLQLATAKIGHIAAALTPGYSAPDLSRLISMMQRCKILFYHSSVHDLVSMTKRQLDSDVATIEFGEGSEWENSIFPSLPNNEPHGATPPSPTYMLLTTSGTTGFPKLVPIQHEALPHSCSNAVPYLPPKAITGGSVGWNHLSSLVVTYWAFSVGGSVLITPRATDVQEMKTQVLVDGKPNAVLLYPSWLQQLLPITERKDWEHLQLLSYGAEPMPYATVTQAMEKLPKEVKFMGLYGTTEIGLSCFIEPENFEDLTPKKAEILNSVGQPLKQSKMELRIVDLITRQPCETGQVGEAEFRGPAVMPGYVGVGADEANADAFSPDGWFSSGDLGHLDEEGNLHLCGRAKETVLLDGSLKLPAAHLDQECAGHEAVWQSLTIGVDLRFYDSECQSALEQVELFVVLKEGYKPTDDVRRDLLQFLEKNLHYKELMPKKIHFVRSLPIGITGKLVRLKLKEMYKNGTLELL